MIYLAKDLIDLNVLYFNEAVNQIDFDHVPFDQFFHLVLDVKLEHIHTVFVTQPAFF